MLRRLFGAGPDELFLAEDKQLGRLVALKLLSAEHNYDPRAAARLAHEARLLARIDHPNVVALHDVGLFGCDVCLTLEHFGNDDLRSWLGAAPRSSGQLREVIVQAARGLAAAHRAGVLHRDLRPQVVRIDERMRVRLIDFGQGRGRDPDSSAWELDQPDYAGHVEYMAPEARASGRRDALADQYSFCVLAWEALTGRRPDADPPRPRPWQPHFELLRVLARGLASAPEQRWSDMDGLLAALERRPSRSRRMLVATVVLGALAGLGWPYLRSEARTNERPEPELAESDCDTSSSASPAAHPRRPSGDSDRLDPASCSTSASEGRERGQPARSLWR